MHFKVPSSPPRRVSRAGDLGAEGLLDRPDHRAHAIQAGRAATRLRGGAGLRDRLLQLGPQDARRPPQPKSRCARRRNPQRLGGRRLCWAPCAPALRGQRPPRARWALPSRGSSLSVARSPSAPDPPTLSGTECYACLGVHPEDCTPEKARRVQCHQDQSACFQGNGRMNIGKGLDWWKDLGKGCRSTAGLSAEAPGSLAGRPGPGLREGHDFSPKVEAWPWPQERDLKFV
jgi:hypothetical protein